MDASLPCGARPQFVRDDEALERNRELRVQSADHVEAQTALAREHFRHPSRRLEDDEQILGRQPLLLDAKSNRFNRIGRRHRMMLALIGIDERSEDLEAIAFSRPWLGFAPETLDLTKSPSVIGVGTNGSNFHGVPCPLRAWVIV